MRGNKVTLSASRRGKHPSAGFTVFPPFVMPRYQRCSRTAALGCACRCCSNTPIDPARGWILTRTRFINCTIRLKRQLNNFSFCHAYLERCVLKGRFSGCEFGRRVDDDPEEPLYYPEAGIVDCDLSAAKLDSCRFINCDLSTLRLPRWPHFTVCDPADVRDQALQLPWPGRTRIVAEIWNMQPVKTVAITENARSVCKQFDATEEELKAVLDQLPGVIM